VINTCLSQRRTTLTIHTLSAFTCAYIPPVFALVLHHDLFRSATLPSCTDVKMTTKLKFLAFGATLFSSVAHAHISMNTPTPYDPQPDTSPLNPDGSNYPCKKTSAGFTIAKVTSASVDQTVRLTFLGSANHAGGSCQISLTTDDASQLSANTKFKVIYSIMGGCPGINGVNNEYDVPIPQEVPAGNYTLSWSWFNNIGNREFYHNCAPVSITGGNASADDFNRLPDMAIYNIPSQNDCKTIETKDVQFPEPGKYFMIGAGAKLSPPTGSCATGGGASDPSDPTNVPSGIGISTSTSMDDGLYHSSTSTLVDTSTTSSSDLAAVSTFFLTSSVTAAGTPIASTMATGSLSNSSYTPPAQPSAPGSSTSSCSPDGSIVCSPDGTQFGLCNFGSATFMAVAPGTHCTNGAIARRGILRV
jgi:hypothetical protein